MKRKIQIQGELRIGNTWERKFEGKGRREKNRKGKEIKASMSELVGLGVLRTKVALRASTWSC